MLDHKELRMEDSYNSLLCRETQINELYSLLGEDDEPLPCSIFVSGSMATGKSLSIETVLNYLNYKHVIINCIECYSPNLLYEYIISGFGGEVNTKCDSMLDLINYLNCLANNLETYAPHVLVLDKADRLRIMEESVLSTFLRLRELCNLNICTILITHLDFYESFNFKLGVREPIQIYFPNYNKDELFKIIFLHQNTFVSNLLKYNNIDLKIKNKIQNPEFFANFLNAFLSVFFRPCRNLIELQDMAQINFVKYCQPIIRNEIQASDLSKLWRHISPILKSSLNTLYLRIRDTDYYNDSLGKEDGHHKVSQRLNLDNTLKEELISTLTYVQSFELPYYAKYVLIAAYLASYNPPKEDKRLFMKHHGKQRKRMQQVKAKAKIYEKLNTQLGPKLFTLDRLLAIFYAILDEKINLTSNLLTQIATLVELKLIAVSKEDDFDSAKYKCIVTYDFILAIAQTVGFNVKKYLYELI